MLDLSALGPILLFVISVYFFFRWVVDDMNR